MFRGSRHSLVAAALMAPCIALASYSIAAAAPGDASLQTQATAGKPLALVKLTKHTSSRAHRKLARHKGHPVKETAANDNKADTPAQSAPAAESATPAETTTPTEARAALPPAIANARAELTAGDVPSRSTLTETDRSATAASDTGNAPNPNGVQIAEADQLNDIDRAMAGDEASDAPAAAPAPAATVAVMQPPTHPHSWDKRAFLVGEIFIAFGTVLTLLSAGRLLMASGSSRRTAA